MAPDWSLDETRVGAVIGVAGVIVASAYSYHVQWRKRLSAAELDRGMRKQAFFRTYLLIPILGLSSISYLLLKGSRFELYFQGGAIVFLIGIVLLALINIHFKKGLAQKAPPRNK